MDIDPLLDAESGLTMWSPDTHNPFSNRSRFEGPSVSFVMDMLKDCRLLLDFGDSLTSVLTLDDAPGDAILPVLLGLSSLLDDDRLFVADCVGEPDPLN